MKNKKDEVTLVGQIHPQLYGIMCGKCNYPTYGPSYCIHCRGEGHKFDKDLVKKRDFLNGMLSLDKA